MHTPRARAILLAISAATLAAATISCGGSPSIADETLAARTAVPDGAQLIFHGELATTVRLALPDPPGTVYIVDSRTADLVYAQFIKDARPLDTSTAGQNIRAGRSYTVFFTPLIGTESQD